MSARHLRPDAGFSLVELLAALTIALGAASIAADLASDLTRAASAQPAMADAQQRARVAMDALIGDLTRAGAGLDADADGGSLARVLPPILPRRIGAVLPDAPAVARGDAVSVIAVSEAAPQGTLDAPLTPGSGVLVPASSPYCANGRLVCGFVGTDRALAFDAAGAFGLFEILSVAPGVAATQRLDPSGAHTFAPGDRFARAQVAVYYHDAARRQLRRYDAHLSDTPVVDDVVSVAFSFAGDPAPPRLPRPPIGTANCLYDAAGLERGLLADLRGPGGPSTIDLPLAMFTDGPWCGVDGTAFDADLLRVRRVTATLRVQAGPDAVRGRVGHLRPGTASSPLAVAPDIVLRFDVAPPNLQVQR
jgi:prepilin-type N-terminal cleavage/methylation domain-containing protein